MLELRFYGNFMQIAGKLGHIYIWHWHSSVLLLTLTFSDNIYYSLHLLKLKLGVY